MTARTPRRASRPHAIIRLMAAAILTAAMAVANAVTGTTSATASTTATAATRPVAGKAPLKDLIGQPVRHVKPSELPEQPLSKPQKPKLPAGETPACPVPSRPDQLQCMGIRRTATTRGVKTGSVKNAAADPATPSGYTPAQLQSAYGLTTASVTGGVSGSAPEVIAISTFYDDPNAVADLAAYRTQFGMIPCISTSALSTQFSLPLGSGCVTKVNENNQTSPLPSATPDEGTGDWTWEASATMDMVSAACPNCEILLVEANDDSITDAGQTLVAAENDADIILGDWGTTAFAQRVPNDQTYLNVPGKALVFGSWSGGNYEAWPSNSQYVTSVGGTTLTSDSSSSRGWDETAWSNGSSPCSASEPKPSWQTADDTSPNGCLNRTDNDIAADADPNPGVAVYDSTADSTYSRAAGWYASGGTTVSSAIIAGVYALKGLPQAGTYPASYPYQSGNSSGFNDITSGTDKASCESNRSYLCTAGSGYDGPTGMGTPNGPSGLAFNSTSDAVSVPNPGTMDYAEGQQANIPLKAVSSDASQAITWSATGLPNGLSINSATGAITGTIPSATGTSKVTATATDASGARESVAFNITIVPSLRASWTAATGPYSSSVSGMCMDDPSGNTAAGTAIHVYTCNSGANQNWTFSPSADPGGAGQILLGKNSSDCLTAGGVTSGSKITIQNCSSGDPHQGWAVASPRTAGSSNLATSETELYNPVSGYCLADPGNSSTNNTQLDIEPCTSFATGQDWNRPAGQILSGIGGDCIDDYQASAANNTKVDLYTCNGKASQDWTLENNGTIQIQNACLDMTQSSTVDGGLAELYTCNGGENQQWVVLRDGQIMNLNSEKCLDDPSNSTTLGTQLVQEDCYKSAGEIWQDS